MIKYKSFYHLASWTNISLNSIIKTTINRELDMDTKFNLIKNIDFQKYRWHYIYSVLNWTFSPSIGFNSARFSSSHSSYRLVLEILGNAGRHEETKKKWRAPKVVVHTFSFSTVKGRQVNLWVRGQDGLMSSRTARDTERDPVSSKAKQSKARQNKTW